MVTIRDRQIRNAYTQLQQDVKTGRATEMTPENMLKVLAGAGDKWNRWEGGTLSALSAPGVTRDEQVALVKAGLDGSETKDLAAILDKGDVPMSAEVKAFFNQVLGREPVKPQDGPVRITGITAGGTISGTAAAGSTVEVINLTTAPEARLHTDDTFALGKAGVDGRFSGTMTDVKEGDILRMRTRDAGGTTSSWVTLRATGIATQDTRNSQVALFRMHLEPGTDGKVTLSNINGSRQLTEPGAELMLVNNRTGERTRIKMNDEGNLDAEVKLKGNKGDTFSVRVSDGRNNKDFSVEAGSITAGAVNETGPGGTLKDLPDPKLHKDELNADGTPRFQSKRYTGPLFRDEPTASDVKQGQIGDCYFPSAIAALAHVQPQAIKNAIKDNGDGTYTVTFKVPQGSSGAFKDKQVTVDGDLASRSWGGPLYGSTTGDTSTTKLEMWFPILEKAYAAMHPGGYNDIGNGGLSSEVFQSILGRPLFDVNTDWSSKDKVWTRIKTSLDAKLPVSAGTHGEDEKARYTNSGVYPDHSYSVLGYKEEAGQKMVQLRNPWGESEPFPGDGKNDGVFWLKLDDFMKLYQTVMTVR